VTDNDPWVRRKRIAHADGRRFAYVEIDGAGPPLLLLHGFSDSSRSFSLLAPELAGRRLVIPDLPGHGGSAPGSDWTPSALAKDMSAFVSAAGLKRSVLVGHSLGSMVALEMAALHPGLFSGLVLLAGTLRPGLDDNHPVVTGVAALDDPVAPDGPFLTYWYHCGPDVPALLLTELAVEAAALPAGRWRALLAGIRDFDRSANPPRIDTPMLILSGDDDHLFDRAHHDALVAAFPEAAELRLVGCSHNPHWDAPRLVARVIDRHFPAST